ncbi:class I SAM-dependent methyltransferase [Streptomyces sp. NPDC001941]|uniref:class I SAM-dependent methyltransferase n=1 Tax=Streptomyces sp. NPDC001941 TaxID=3154659 RepID=UPI003328A626
MTDTTTEVARLRPVYQRELALGTDRFYEDRRPDCPWCGSTRLRTRLRTTDSIQRKPGTFVVDQCRGCRHSFQNPRLSPEGLDFYYRDFYDGLGEGTWGKAFTMGTSQERYAAAARSVAPYTRPGRWLDVGTANADFCVVAKQVFPDTAFEGVDCGESVEAAARAGRIEKAHRGFLPELAGSLADRFDVVSMHHVLEHTVDPRAELAAAHTVLRPGGHLLIEVPNPESPLGRVFGKYWVPWFQPQHLHFVTRANLCRALAEQGFTVVASDTREPHVPIDVVGAVGLAVVRHMPYRDEPWLAKAPGRREALLRKAFWYASFPALFAAHLVDRALEPLLRRTRFSNAYRVIARKD